MQDRAQESPTGWRPGILARETFAGWSADDVPRLAASLAYYSVLSAAPLLVMSIALADLVYGQQAVEGQLAWEIQNFVGGNAAQAIQSALQGAHKAAAGAIATTLGIATLILGASSVIVELHEALNKIWGVKAPDESTWRDDILGFLKERIFAALIAIAAGCLLLISLALSVSIAALGEFFLPLLPSPEWLLHSAAFVASFLVVMILFGAVYKLIPDVRLKWSDVTIGAAVTSLLFTIGKQLIALYLGRVGFQSTYGAAWAVVLFLVWVYYSAQLFFLGAEFTKVYTRRFGSHGAASPPPELPSVTKSPSKGPT
ncbi:MAG TPA: YihY/virulence factor BrkB family protein [Bryobacteraceae bacterium]|nr:YihY/virulence factor BrkB family protein [Bryobacteraceae bacterium]